MSLGPRWCLGVLFGCFCLGKRLALGRGHLERTWAARLARAGADGLREERWRDASFLCRIRRSFLVSYTPLVVRVFRGASCASIAEPLKSGYDALF